MPCLPHSSLLDEVVTKEGREHVSDGQSVRRIGKRQRERDEWIYGERSGKQRKEREIDREKTEGGVRVSVYVWWVAMKR